MTNGIASLKQTLPQNSKQGNTLAKNVLEHLIERGVQEFCVCPSSRNAPLVYPLADCTSAKVYYWSEERSAAFFALGRIKATQKPVAVVVTSGTAVAELLPAAMEAYYTGLPLILITADRPKRFRASGAPQAVEQAGLFGCYALSAKDLEEGNEFNLHDWAFDGPLHINICFEEPKDLICQNEKLNPTTPIDFLPNPPRDYFPNFSFSNFISSVKCPLIIVGALHPTHHKAVIQLLHHLKAPVYAEGTSGIRDNPLIEHLQIHFVDDVWKSAAQNNYCIDGVIRIGGVPTTRLWRDLEEFNSQIKVFSVHDLHFSGLSWTAQCEMPLTAFCSWALNTAIPVFESFFSWKQEDYRKLSFLLELFEKEPLAEPSLIHQLSKKIPKESKIYLGNSLPIREWDLAAIRANQAFQICSNRGANGIDGQLATFLGYSCNGQDNWALLGDLSLLYDMAAPWITSQIASKAINVVVINNKGGQIFSRMFSHPAFLNEHNLSFKSFAQFWEWDYEKWEMIPSRKISSHQPRLIELCPHPKATKRFWMAWENYFVCGKYK